MVFWKFRAKYKHVVDRMLDRESNLDVKKAERSTPPMVRTVQRILSTNMRNSEYMSKDRTNLHECT
jgi:hypothetical protein